MHLFLPFQVRVLNSDHKVCSELQCILEILDRSGVRKSSG